MSTFIHGIASSQAIDTAGEVVDLAGLDISSLVGSVFNYEHKSDVPAQIVGKILFAKKIFQPEDCENDAQKKFWETCKLPFLYVMGQLFDDYSDSAKEIAGIFTYDADNGDKPRTLGFSIEGSKIAKEGMIVTRSIARKVTVTATPANKTCIAEAIVPPEKEQSDDLAAIFKSEVGLVNLLMAQEAADFLGIPMHKAEEDYKKGSIIGQTSTGKDVYSHGIVHASGFTPDEHKEAAQMHFDAANQNKANPKLAQNHYNKYKLHQGAYNTSSAKRERIQSAQMNVQNVASSPAPETNKMGQKLFDPALSGTVPKKKMVKAMDAGSGMAAPGQLTNGAALAPQSLGKKLVKAREGMQKAEKEFHEQKYPHSVKVRVHFKDSTGDWHHDDEIKGLNHGHAMHRAKHNWPDAHLIESLDMQKAEDNFDHSKATNGELIRRHKKNSEKLSKLSDKLISSGHGHLKPSDVRAMKDRPAHMEQYLAHLDDNRKIRNEAERRYGPGLTSVDQLKDLPRSRLKKNEMLARAEQDYNAWSKRSEFEKFMKERLPHLAKGEIIAIGQVIALKKSREAEAELADLIKHDDQNKKTQPAT